MVWRSGRLLWGLLVVLVLSCRISLDLVKAQEDGEAIPGSCEGEEDQQISEQERQVPLSRSRAHVFEGFKPFSQSHLWDIMLAYYERRGHEAWSTGDVPYWVSSNAPLAKSYAQVINGFFKDCSSGKASLTLDPKEPLYIIEIGAGHGKFSFHLLEALTEMKEVLGFPYRKIVYVMTDYSSKNVDRWARHPRFAPYYKSGMLEASIFNAHEDLEITLARSGKVLRPGKVKNPIVMVGNYILDTLHQDVFQVENGELKEGLISLGSKNRTEPDPLDPEILRRMDNHYLYNVTTSSHYSHLRDEEGDEVHFQRILNWYHKYFEETPGASLLFPIGAFRVLRHILALTGNRGLVLAGDKCITHPDRWGFITDPDIETSHGGFSLMVDFHAIGVYTVSKGGFVLHDTQESSSFKVSSFLFTGDNSTLGEQPLELWEGTKVAERAQKVAMSYPKLTHAFTSTIGTYCSSELSGLFDGLVNETATPFELGFEELMALLKLSSWDQNIFSDLKWLMVVKLANATIELKEDFSRGLQLTWNNYFQMKEDEDVAFDIARIYFRLADFDRALHFYEEHTSFARDHPSRALNMELCRLFIDNPMRAFEMFKGNLDIDHDYREAELPTVTVPLPEERSMSRSNNQQWNNFGGDEPQEQQRVHINPRHFVNPLSRGKE